MLAAAYAQSYAPFLFVCFVVSLCLYFFFSVFSGPSFTFVVSLSLCYESLRRVPAKQQRHRRWRKNTSFSLSFGDSRNSVRKKNHFLWILIHTAHFYFFRCLSNFFSENIELLWRRPVVAFILLFASPHHSCPPHRGYARQRSDDDNEFSVRRRQTTWRWRWWWEKES